MKKILKPFISLIFIGLLLSCNPVSWELPETVKVKSKAEVDLALMKTTLDLSDTMSMNQIFMSGMTANSKTYDFSPKSRGDKVKSFLVKLPIQEIPVDFSQYFDDTSLASEIKGLSFDEQIEIPKLNMGMDETIIITNVVPLINALVVVEETENTNTNNLVFKNGFDEITYKSGTLTVHFSNEIFGGNVELRYNGKTVASTIAFGNSCTLDLEDVTIYRTGMLLELPSEVEKFGIEPDLTSIQKKVKNLTLDSPVQQEINSTLEKPEGKPFEECKVTKGELGIEFVMPEEWTGATVSYSVYMEGGIDAYSAEVPGEKKTIQLDGKVIKCMDTEITSNFTILFQNANIEIGTDKAPKLKVESSVSEYEYITLEMKDVNPSLSKNEYVSQEIKSIITKIIFTESGLKGTYINTLPEGNDIALNANSAFFDLINKNATLSGNTATATPISLLSGDGTDTYTNTVTFGGAIGEFSEIDFGVNLVLPGATPANPKCLTINNVKPEQKYQIKLDLEPEINWDKITIKTKGTTQSGCISTGINIGQILSSYAAEIGPDFAGKLDLKRIPIGIYAVKPDIPTLKDAKFTGTMDICYGTLDTLGHPQKNPNFNSVQLQSRNDDGSAETGVIKLVSEMPQFEYEDEITKQTIISELDVTQGSSAYGDLAALVNSTKGVTDGGSIIVDYNFRFSNSDDPTVDNFTIDYTDYANTGSKASSIAIYAFVEIPMEFKINGEINVNVMSLITGDSSGQTGEDFLGRSQGMTDEEIPEIVKALRSVELGFDIRQLPFYANPSPELIVDMDGALPNLGEHKIVLEEEKNYLPFDDIQDMLKTYPLEPQMTLRLKEGDLTIPRNVAFTTVLGIYAKIDPDYEMEFSGLFGGN